MERRISKDGLDLIKEFEGWSATTYYDVAGFPTIGYGHLLKDGERFDEPITKLQGEALLLSDIDWAEDAVNAEVEVGLNQFEFDALCSLVYNIGRRNFANSTLLVLLNQNKRTLVAGEFGKWKKAGGKVVQGLVNRRAREAQLFLKVPQ